MQIVKDCKEVLIVYILQLVLIVICSLICSLLDYDVVIFMANQFYYVIVGFYLILSLFLVYRYKVKDNVVDGRGLFISIYLLLSLSIILNMLFYLFGLQSSGDNKFNIILLIISSGILGPIVEEYLFRNILLNRLLDRYSGIKAIMIESFIFGLFHFSLNGFIYAFIIGVCLSGIYIKFKNIKLPIICHMVSNIFVLFLVEFNVYILMLAFICLLISMLVIYKNNMFGKDYIMK